MAGFGATGADGGIDAGGAANTHRASRVEDGTDDRRNRERGTMAGASEGHDSGERKRVCCGGNHVLLAWVRRKPAGRGCQGVGYSRYGGPLTPAKAARPSPTRWRSLTWGGQNMCRDRPRWEVVIGWELAYTPMELIFTVRSLLETVTAGALAPRAVKRPTAFRAGLHEGRGPPIRGGLLPEPLSSPTKHPCVRDGWYVDSLDHGGAGPRSHRRSGLRPEPAHAEAERRARNGSRSSTSPPLG